MRDRILKLSAVIGTLAAVAVGSTAVAVAGGSNSGAKAKTTHVTRSHKTVAAATKAANRSKTTPARSGAAAGEGEQTASEESSKEANDTDGAAQAAACTKAGIDPNADNVQYDDQSGTCSRDGGSNANG
jgi:hypothetical protein